MTRLLLVFVLVAQPDSLATARLKYSQKLPKDTFKRVVTGTIANNYGLVVSLDESRTCRMRFVKDRHLVSIHPHMHVPSSFKGEFKLGGGGSGVSIAGGRDDYFADVVIKHGGHKDSIELFALATVQHELKKRSLASGASLNLSDRLPRFKFLYVAPAHLLRDDLRHVEEPEVRVCNVACQSLRGHSHESVSVELTENGLEIFLPVEEEITQRPKGLCSEPGQGYSALEQLFASLVPLQTTHAWKFSLAQQAIGGASPVTASKLLIAGRLTGNALTAFTDQFMTTLHDLQGLSVSNEQCQEASVRNEFAHLSQISNPDPANVSSLADKYVGHAIKKNFHPLTGRFANMRAFADRFSVGSLFLQVDESEPAYLLSLLLKESARLENVFANAPTGLTALDIYSDSWRNVLELAINLAPLSTCVWNCGLADAGLHNLFFSGELGVGSEQLWFFDLGKPEVLPLPALLTKFLMSFFHVLGMEEVDGNWVNRFVPRGAVYDSVQRPGEVSIHLTERSQLLLPLAREAFQFVLRRLILEFFMGQWSVCKLLIDYVVLQLLSDAAFCLERWWAKGGGQRRERPQDLHQWLWRSTWDIYIASDVAHREWCS